MEKTFNFAVYQQRLNVLIEKTRNLLRETNNEELAQRLNADLEGAADRKEFRLAFVGQYSAGKSTIISALTGNKDIKIDANVATDKVSEYHWNNIVLMDTPGILAGKVEAHDERTKEALAESDLIFYVLTSQLFDNVVFDNFIDLAYNQHFADKMFIIVNKMSMESGNYKELVANYTASLKKIFSEKGYDVTKFPIAFIDAYDYIDGTDEQDEEFIQLSHFEQFIDMLNSFVSKKGVIKKQFDTPIRHLQSYAKSIAVSAVDTMLADTYRQFEKKLLNSKKELRRDVEDVLYSFDSSAMKEVILLTNQIGEGIGEQEWKIKQTELNEKLDRAISETSNKIDETAQQNYERLMNEVEDFGNKNSLTLYSEHLQQQLNAPNIGIEEKRSLMSQSNALEWLRRGGTEVSKLAPNVNSLMEGISKASGSNLHKVVYNVSKFFGKDFKPWQAVRWASNIAKFAKFGIPIVAGGIDIFLQLKNEREEREYEKEIKSAKNQMVTRYKIEINKIKEQFEKYLTEILKNYQYKQDEANRLIDQITATAKKNGIITNKINELEKEYVDFIEIIEKEN